MRGKGPYMRDASLVVAFSCRFWCNFAGKVRRGSVGVCWKADGIHPDARVPERSRAFGGSHTC